MKAQTLLFSFFLTLTLFSPSFGQPDILRLSFPVQSNGDVILNPFTGGLNNPQPSKVDLNNDGVEDLFVFDRAGNIPMTFLHSGIPGEAVYTFAPEYAENFPPLFNWVLLRDYNGDGIQDIFAHYPTPVQGIQVWTGYYDAEDRIAFEQFQFCCEAFNIIYYTLTNGSTTQVYVSPVDFPAFNDVDGDGDLDILTFGIGGGYVEYFQNRSIQLGFGKDSLIFKRQDPCWGKFYEASFSEEIVLLFWPRRTRSGAPQTTRCSGIMRTSIPPKSRFLNWCRKTR
ncbi:MAG: VCBS repeat-containing protein [Saprospirales bacterium]|nr:VCBS repeat-containing protein [Saprospirales bacterium]